MSVDKSKESDGLVHITFEAEFFRDLLQLRDTGVMRRQMLDISPVELLTQFYKVEIVFFKLPLLDWFFLARIVPELQCASNLSCFPRLVQILSWYLLAPKVCENENLS
jgi:hypothetical protein